MWDIHKIWLEEVGCRVALGAVVGARDPPGPHSFICIVDSALTSHPQQYTLTVQDDKVRLQMLIPARTQLLFLCSLFRLFI